MLALLLTCLNCLPCLPAVVQDLPAGFVRRAPAIDPPTPFDPGERVRFARIQETRLELDGAVVEQVQLIGDVLLTAEEGPGELERRLRWAVSNPRWVGELGDWRNLLQPQALTRAALPGLVSFQVDASSKFRTIELAEVDEVRDRVDQAIDQSNQLKSWAVSSRGLLELTMLSDPQLLLDPLGRRYRLGEQRNWDDYLLNPLRERPIPARATVEPLLHDEQAKTLLVRRAFEVDREGSGAALAEDLASWMRRRDKTREAPDPDRDFEYGEEARILLDLQSGLPMVAERRVHLRVLGVVQDDRVRYLREDCALPDDWDAAWTDREPSNDSPASGGASGAEQGG